MNDTSRQQHSLQVTDRPAPLDAGTGGSSFPAIRPVENHHSAQMVVALLPDHRRAVPSGTEGKCFSCDVQPFSAINAFPVTCAAASNVYPARRPARRIA